MRWRRDLTWNPRDLGWRIAALFALGSFLFALGSFPPYSQLVDGRLVGVTFVVGSIIFTAAGYGQFLQLINEGDTGGSAAGARRLWSWRPRTTLWWATVVQLAGTLLFDASTIDAMFEAFTTQETNRLVWAPDFFGSVAFVIASHLTWLTVCHRLWCVRRDDHDWWGALVNYAGSICFMASAIASFTLTTTGKAVNTTIVNAGTFLGAVCFIMGAYLLLPPMRVEAPPRTATDPDRILERSRSATFAAHRRRSPPADDATVRLMSDDFRYDSGERLPVEVMVFEVDPEHVEEFLAVDHEVWTLGEAESGGSDHIPFLSKEVWLDDAHPGRVILTFVWESIESWRLVGERQVQQRLQARFDALFPHRVTLLRALHEESNFGIHRVSRFERLRRA